MKSKMNPSATKSKSSDISSRMKTESHNKCATDKLKEKVASKHESSEKK